MITGVLLMFSIVFLSFSFRAIALAAYCIAEAMRCMYFTTRVAAPVSDGTAAFGAVDNLIHVSRIAFCVPRVRDFVWIVCLFFVIPSSKHCHCYLQR